MHFVIGCKEGVDIVISKEIRRTVRTINHAQFPRIGDGWLQRCRQGLFSH